MKCPACFRGELDQRGICQRCNIGVPLSCRLDRELAPDQGRRPIRIVHLKVFWYGGIGEYVNTKADKE